MKSLPVDVLKIDRMFIEDLSEDSNMIAAVTMLTQGLDLQMIAEGVKAEARRNWLAKAGVGIAQGFLFARSLPAEVFEESYLEEKQPSQTDHKTLKSAGSCEPIQTS